MEQPIRPKKPFAKTTVIRQCNGYRLYIVEAEGRSDMYVSHKGPKRFRRMRLQDSQTVLKTCSEEDLVLLCEEILETGSKTNRKSYYETDL